VLNTPTTVTTDTAVRTESIGIIDPPLHSTSVPNVRILPLNGTLTIRPVLTVVSSWSKVSRNNPFIPIWRVLPGKSNKLVLTGR